MLSNLDAVHRTPAAAELLTAARELVPYLREQAAQCELDRRVSETTIQKFTRAGLFNIPKPRRYGGYEMGWDVFSEVVMTLASGCGSSGWVYSVVGGHAVVVTRFGTTLMDEIWYPNPDALLSSCRRASGELVRVEGGYQGSIHAVFSSGCLNADWVIIDGVPVQGDSQALTVVVPIKDVEILDTWRVAGLAGTGSHDLRCQNVFIPAHRTWFLGKPPHGEALDSPVFRTVHLGIPFSLPSVVLGIALGGFEYFIATANKRSARQGGSVAELQSMQIRIGESAIEIDAALALLRSKLKDIIGKLSGHEPDRSAQYSVLPAGGAAPRYDLTAAGFVAHAGYAALHRLMEAAGASQLALSAPFQRCFRDALAGIQQPSNNWDNCRTVGGRELLERFKSSDV